MAYFHDSGIFARLTATYVNQHVFQASWYEGDFDHSANNNFTLVDLGLGYRLPRRYGIINCNVRNLFDSRFDYQGYQLRNAHQDAVPEFTPGRAFFGQITLAF